MSDDSTGQAARTPGEQEAYNEAVERQRRLQVWLDGMLGGGPALSDAVKQWRRAIPMYSDSSDEFVEDKDNLTVGIVKPAEDLLLEARLRIRNRRNLADKPPLAIAEEEVTRRSLQVIEDVKTDHTANKEFTPLHWVLAARFVEGEIDWEEYRIRPDSDANSGA